MRTDRPGSEEWLDKSSKDMMYVLLAFALIFGIPAAWTYFLG